MNLKNMEKFLKKNYKKIIVVCLIMLLFSNKMYENFTPTEALDAVKATEKKVNDMASKVGPNNVDFKSGIRLSKNWMNGANDTNSEISNDIGHYKKLMVIGNKSSGTRKVGVWDHLDVHGTERVSGNFRAGRVDSDGDIKGKRLCIGGTCLSENHLKILTKGFKMKVIGSSKGSGLFLHSHSDGRRIGPHGGSAMTVKAYNI
jgi:hypothetical protein